MATNSQPQETPEYRTLREHYERLVNAISEPLPLAARLFARSIIDSTLLQRVNVPALPSFQNTSTLLSAVLGKIQSDPSAFGAFLSALNEDPSMQSLVESIERGLLSTTSGTHGGGESVQSRDGGEELSTPAVKRKCVREENSVSLVSGSGRESVCCRSHTPTGQVIHQQHQCEHQHQYSHPPLHTLYHPPFHPPAQVVHPPPHQHEPPVQPHTYQSPHYPPLQPSLRYPSYQHPELTYHQPSHHPPNHHTEPTQPSYHQPSCHPPNHHTEPTQPSYHQPSRHPPNHHTEPTQPSYHQPSCHPPNQHTEPTQPSYHQPSCHPPNHHTEPTQPSYHQPSCHPPNQHTEPTQPSYHQPSCHPPNHHTEPTQPFHHQPSRHPPNHHTEPTQPSYHQPSCRPPNHHTEPTQPSYHQPSCHPPNHHTEPTQPSYHQPSCHPPNPPSSNHAHLPTSQIRFHQPYIRSYKRPINHSSHRPLFRVHSPFHQLPRMRPSTVLEVYADFLQSHYAKHKFTSTKWPNIDIGKYISLAVISNAYANREELERFRQQTIRGSIDDILEWKAPIAVEDILKPNCNLKTCEIYPVTQLLIEGAPGIGKSTFAWELCHKWSQRKLFNEYSMVVLLKFRDKRVQEAKSVSDLFHYPLPELQSDIVHDIVLSGGHGLLLILEGFDEAPASKRTTDSIFVRLFTGQELPKATVILTTRPSASAGLRQFCKGKNFRRIEIVGFGKMEIDEYIQCAFSDDQSRSDFKEYLSLYPHIHSMMYVPLNSAIVTHVYESCKSSDTVVPKTMTQLYSSLIRTLLLRYLKDKEEYKDTCTNINCFKDLPQPVYDQFCEICKIAYKGIECAETELIFQDLPSDFDTLGLMQTCPELYVDRGASVSYNFLHLTVQEYLAAYHISQQSRDEQVAFMREHIESEKLEVVVRFLAGLTELGRNLWDVVREFACDDKHNIRLEILHWHFESQCASAVTSVLGSDYVCFCDSVLPFDWYVLGYCIAHSSCNWKLELYICELESVELFLRALNLKQDQCQLRGKIKEMWSMNEDEPDPAIVHLLVNNMPQMSVFHNMTHLSLECCGLTSETCNLLSKCNLQHLEYLDLSGNRNIDSGGTVNLITSLTKFSTIRELHLSYSGIGFEDCKALSELLATSKCIKFLDISDDEFILSPDSVQLIVDGLSHNTSLEKLNMRYSNFSSQNVFQLASVLRVNTRLKELNIRWCDIQSSDSVHLAKALEENTTTQLQTLQLEGNTIGSEGAAAFTDMLATNKSLAELDMRECSIQGKGSVCLAKALEKNSTVREFDISDNPIGSEGAVAFATMLKKNQSLKKLGLYDDSVGVEGALELIESLKHNTTLEELELSKKCKPPSFSTLDKMLQDRVTFSYC